MFLQLWWNADEARLSATLLRPPATDWTGHPIRGGEPGAVGRSRLDRRLLLREAVHGPDVEPGTYELLWVMGTVNPSPGYALLTSEVPFEVTDWIRRAASGCPESFLLDYLKEGYRARGAASECCGPSA